MVAILFSMVTMATMTRPVIPESLLKFDEILKICFFQLVSPLKQTQRVVWTAQVDISMDEPKHSKYDFHLRIINKPTKNKHENNKNTTFKKGKPRK